MKSEAEIREKLAKLERRAQHMRSLCEEKPESIIADIWESCYQSAEYEADVLRWVLGESEP
jgi:hypothetical protein